MWPGQRMRATGGCERGEHRRERERMEDTENGHWQPLAETQGQENIICAGFLGIDLPSWHTLPTTDV